ncbi:SUKH-4 family immunity protein [Botryobacter ruber]|uniref:SUKH-4 family immunity protein n=1 Tax=Botryobacter ruber TaxID=2171629 RepID=UPI000E0B0DA6|nr:SUKH-4 family immunity protein [Botryobacter ruber]
MTPAELKQIWPEEDLIKVNIDSVNNFSLQSSTKDLLTISGIPKGFEEISFDDLSEGLNTVNKSWNLEDTFFDQYLAIGSNGSGDPVAINLNNKECIVYLNHDNGFQEVFINTNIEKLVETIVRLREFSKVKHPLKEDSFWITEFTDEEYERLKADLSRIDNNIFENEGSHWKDTIDYYLWEREEERKNTAQNTI